MSVCYDNENNWIYIHFGTHRRHIHTNQVRFFTRPRESRSEVDTTNLRWRDGDRAMLLVILVGKVEITGSPRIHLHPRKLTARTWKWRFGRKCSFSGGVFSGSMLFFRGAPNITKYTKINGRSQKPYTLTHYCWWFRNPKANHLGWC